MRELTVSELDAVAGGQFSVVGDFSQSNSASVTQMATASATNLGAITAMATGGSASAAGATAAAANLSSVLQSNSITGI